MDYFPFIGFRKYKGKPIEFECFNNLSLKKCQNENPRIKQINICAFVTTSLFDFNYTKLYKNTQLLQASIHKKS